MLKWEVSVKVPSPAGINTRAFSTGYSRCLCAPWFVEVAAEQEAAAHSMDTVAVVHISCCRSASGVLPSLSRLHLCSVAAHEGAVTQLSARSSCSKTLTLLSPGGRNPLLWPRVCHFTDTLLREPSCTLKPLKCSLWVLSPHSQLTWESMAASPCCVQPAVTCPGAPGGADPHPAPPRTLELLWGH